MRHDARFRTRPPQIVGGFFNATYRATDRFASAAPLFHLLFLILLLLTDVSVICPGKPMARLVKVITPITTNRSDGEYTVGANESTFPNPNPNRSSASGSATLILESLGQERLCLQLVVKQSL